MILNQVFVWKQQELKMVSKETKQQQQSHKHTDTQTFIQTYKHTTIHIASLLNGITVGLTITGTFWVSLCIFVLIIKPRCFKSSSGNRNNRLMIQHDPTLSRTKYEPEKNKKKDKFELEVKVCKNLIVRFARLLLTQSELASEKKLIVNLIIRTITDHAGKLTPSAVASIIQFASDKK